MIVFVGGARPLLLRGIAAVLEEAGFAVTAATAQPRRLAQLLACSQAQIAVIDILATDVSAVRCVHQLCPRVPILAVMSPAPIAHLEVAVGAGASGCMVDDEPPNHLVSAVRALRAGSCYLSSEIVTPGDGLPHGRLRQVLAGVALGESNKEIAERLRISVRTVESHRRRLMTNFGMRGTADMVRYAIRLGIVSP